MSWIEKKVEFQRRFDELAQEDIPQLITRLNLATKQYILKAGLTQNTDANDNPDYQNIFDLSKRAEAIKKRYISLNNDIINCIKSESKYNNLSNLLTENGTLQQEINGLQQVQDQMKTDVESAVARDELLRSRKTDISPHKLFLLDRPVRRNMIPYLWVLSIICIGVGLILLRMSLPLLGYTPEQILALSANFLEMVTSFYINNVAMIAIIVSLIVVIIILSLVVGGVFR